MKQYPLLGIALLAACAQDPSASPSETPTSACEESAAQLVGCSDAQRQAFMTTCDELGETAIDPEEVGAACKPVADSIKGDGATNAFMGLCVASMYGLKWGIGALSPTAEPLPANIKAQLRPLYGDLVDDVRISIGATLPPKVKLGGRELTVEPAAMTFGNKIYVRQSVLESTRTPYELLFTAVHETTHAFQAQRAGGFYGFTVEYCRGVVAGGYSYDNVPLEKEAYSAEGQARHNVLRWCGKVTCP